MKLKTDTSLWLRRAGAATILAAAQAGAATIITADGTPWADNTAISSVAGFGSNVTTTGNGYYAISPGLTGVIGTPDISLTFQDVGTGGQGWDQYTNWNGRGNVIQMESNGNTQTLTLTPTGSQAVVLSSAEFDEWAGGGSLSVNWTVTGATSGTISSGTWSRTTGGRDLVNFAATGALGEALTLSLTRTSGSSSYFAVDNLTFDQVPEASSMLLGAAGLGALAMRRRRN
ncbi:MAG: proteinsorting protein/MYXO-CTERM protein [Akkermansiaceae bacterium]|nr:proteinsorting protein/MYXO-CTERM protein [Akkermansiaceae bacterium]